MSSPLIYKEAVASAAITITGSKSESNRLLILRALFSNLEIENISNSDDTKVLESALSNPSQIIDVHHAGTAIRFLTAFLAVTATETITLTGSKRMQERPIKILVEALNEMGASISYKSTIGYPPIEIKPPSSLKKEVTLDARVSSQYISALMLVAPLLKDGLEINLIGEITSRPYIEMTLKLLNQVGVLSHFDSQKIIISPVKDIEKKTIVVESDWSSASYFYSIVVLSKIQSITLSSYKSDSLQGDAALVSIYKTLGVSTIFNANNSITLSRNSAIVPEHIALDLTKTPDIAQTIAVSCFGLGISCDLKGLHTLKIKETDRLQALKNELEKLGANVSITHNSLSLEHRINPIDNSRLLVINTYQDHRMAMAFAPLACLAKIAIEEPMVVTKSYPDFYIDLEKVGLYLN